jgi:hypothetical protein
MYYEEMRRYKARKQVPEPESTPELEKVEQPVLIKA